MGHLQLLKGLLKALVFLCKMVNTIFPVNKQRLFMNNHYMELCRKTKEEYSGNTGRKLLNRNYNSETAWGMELPLFFAARALFFFEISSYFFWMSIV